MEVFERETSASMHEDDSAVTDHLSKATLSMK
jgi:hypothetical protein